MRVLAALVASVLALALAPAAHGQALIGLGETQARVFADP